MTHDDWFWFDKPFGWHADDELDDCTVYTSSNSSSQLFIDASNRLYWKSLQEVLQRRVLQLEGQTMSKSAAQPAKTKLVGTKAIIQAYLDNGGAAMSEEEYQKYKQAMLDNWLEKYFSFNPGKPKVTQRPFCFCGYFDTDHPRPRSTCHDGYDREQHLTVTLELAIPEHYQCRECNEQILSDNDMAIAHLKVHHPTWFEGEKERDEK